MQAFSKTLIVLKAVGQFL